MITSFSGQYRFLSNFYFSRVELDGEVYPTVEHAYQAAKTVNQYERSQIRSTGSPAMAKALGNAVDLRRDWEAVKIDIMRDLLRQKFSKPSMMAMLLATGDQEIVEGNWWKDTFWGQCPLGNGQNWLGRLLMEIRSAG